MHSVYIKIAAKMNAMQQADWSVRDKHASARDAYVTYHFTTKILSTKQKKALGD